ncbi:HD domain-containing protein [Geobacter pelophilus]|uniref:HD domain-containing protein n=1 Tax=Geoanaerobacter pelophilus TaxID=60036 RepID=A0AAW4LH01_9BACT|nr:HD domain-containing protein [Geoanaerobacter pelophilus]MBT0666431.1 HD domain-containing protein [Geoanaerobacter pelophilus]
MDSPNFTINQLRECWDRYLRYLPPMERGIASKLLFMYDGARFYSPAVFTSPPEEDPDLRFTPFTRAGFESVPLGQHVVYAVEALARLLPASELMYSSAMLATLCCDLGKIPGIVDRLVDNHAIYGMVLSDRYYLKGLGDTLRENVLNAILLHHANVNSNTKDSTILCDLVRKVHQMATLTAIRELSMDLTSLIATWRRFKAEPFIHPRREWYRYVESTTPIDFSWLDPQLFLAELAPLINRTLPDEFVYLTKDDVALVSVDTFLKIVRKMALDQCWMDILVFEADHLERWRMVTLIIERFLGASDVIAIGLLGKDHRLARFDVGYRSGKRLKAKLIPINVATLGTKRLDALRKGKPAWARVTACRKITEKEAESVGWRDDE